MPTISELLEQRAALEKQIAEAQREAKSSAIAQVKALMAEHGLSLADLNTRAAPSVPKTKAPSGKVAVKYRNATTGETWTGRGLQPKWLKAALASGKQLSDFAV